MNGVKEQGKREIVVILENIRSSHNVGSIFRTADAAGVSQIILGGYTPGPVDDFLRPNTRLAKTSLGAENSVPWRREESILEYISMLQKEDFMVIAVEQGKRSIHYREIDLHQKTAFIFGNEVSGVSPEVCEASDYIAEIPMYGVKESLNVAVSVGIILYGAAGHFSEKER